MIQSELICPISREIFEVPVISSDGFSYEKTYITKWMREHNLSPMLGNTLESTALLENKALSSYMTAYKGLRQRLIFPKQSKSPKKRIVEEKVPEELKDKFEEVLNHYYKSTLELDECCKRMNEIYKTAPNNFELTMNLANTLRFSTQFSKSLSLIKRMKYMRPDSLIPAYMKIRVLAESGEKSKANASLEKIQNKNKIPDHGLIEMRFMSYALLSVSNREGAYRTVTTYLKLIPNDSRAISHCIYINLLQENYNFVINTSIKYLEKHPDDVSILFHQAKAYAKLDKKPEAVNIYKLIASIAKDSSIRSKALYESAVNKDCATQFEEMVQELEESFRLDPKEEADGYLAALYADKQMFDKAEEWVITYEKRMDITNDQVFLGIKAQIQLNKKMYEEAILTYIRLAEIDSVNSMYYNNKIEEIFRKKMAEDK